MGIVSNIGWLRANPILRQGEIASSTTKTKCKHDRPQLVENARWPTAAFRKPSDRAMASMQSTNTTCADPSKEHQGSLSSCGKRLGKPEYWRAGAQLGRGFSSRNASDAYLEMYAT
jgi:hypothetical protein